MIFYIQIIICLLPCCLLMNELVARSSNKLRSPVFSSWDSLCYVLLASMCFFWSRSGYEIQI